MRHWLHACRLPPVLHARSKAPTWRRMRAANAAFPLTGRRVSSPPWMRAMSCAQPAPHWAARSCARCAGPTKQAPLVPLPDREPRRAAPQMAQRGAAGGTRQGAHHAPGAPLLRVHWRTHECSVHQYIARSPCLPSLFPASTLTMNHPRCCRCGRFTSLPIPPNPPGQSTQASPKAHTRKGSRPALLSLAGAAPCGDALLMVCMARARLPRASTPGAAARALFAPRSLRGSPTRQNLFLAVRLREPPRARCAATPTSRGPPPPATYVASSCAVVPVHAVACATAPAQTRWLSPVPTGRRCATPPSTAAACSQLRTSRPGRPAPAASPCVQHNSTPALPAAAAAAAAAALAHCLFMHHPSRTRTLFLPPARRRHPRACSLVPHSLATQLDLGSHKRCRYSSGHDHTCFVGAGWLGQPIQTHFRPHMAILPRGWRAPVRLRVGGPPRPPLDT